MQPTVIIVPVVVQTQFNPPHNKPYKAYRDLIIKG